MSTRSFNTESKKGFTDALGELNWANVTSQISVDTAFNEFWSTFSSLYDLYFPLIKKRLNRNIHKLNDYMTRGLLISRTEKIKLHKLALINPTEVNCNKYKSYRNLFNTLVRKSKKLYYDFQIAKNTKNSKKTWDIFNEITLRKTSAHNLNEIEINGIVSSNKMEMANEFNNFFSKIGNKTAKSIKKVNIKPDSYLPKNDNIPSMNFDEIGPILVCDILKSLVPKKSCDMDGISTQLLKYLNTVISTPLAYIFNLSLTSGNFPSRLKKSRVVPIFKNGDPKKCDNYRPISLLSSISKILEKIVAVKLTNHLELNKLLCTTPFGFQRGKTTEHNLILMTNYVSNALNNGEYCIGIYLDLKKAFDVVNHNILLAKLINLGVKGTSLKWFRSYLSSRSQCVDINGTISPPLDISISVLQGSILGPLLFLCFINDLIRSSNLLMLLFADDTACLASGKNLKDLIKYCNSELQKIANWFSSNKMVVNVNKCKYIIFHNKGKKLDCENLNIYLNLNEAGKTQEAANIIELDRIHNNSPLLENRTYKYLGILLDENLLFNKHIDYICNKLSKALFCLRRAKPLLNTKSLTNLYHALFNSHLHYCTTILSCASRSNIQRIHIMQKKAIRLITHSNYNAHTKQLFINLKILPFDKLITLKQLTFMHAIKYNYAPSPFINSWSLNSDRELGRDLRNLDDFILPAPKFEGFRNFPLYSFTKAWNNCGVLKYYQNPVTFKIATNDQLFLELENS